MTVADGQATCQYVATLSGHDKAVNCVRFHPSNTVLATGGDDGLLLLWALDEDKTAQLARECPDGLDAEGAPAAREAWRVDQRIHLPTDVYDIAWAPTGAELAVASTDSKVTLFHFLKSGQASKVSFARTSSSLRRVRSPLGRALIAARGVVSAHQVCTRRELGSSARICLQCFQRQERARLLAVAA